MNLSFFERVLLAFLLTALASVGWAQQSKPTPVPTKRPVSTPTPSTSASPTKPASKPVTNKPAQTTADKAKPGAPASAPTQAAKPTVTVEQLLEQGKAFYTTGKFPQALAKFEAALKLEEEHDEAVALAAITAYRLDDQGKARTWFLRRAELRNQKDSVRAFCFYRAALSYWREAHDEIALNGEYKNGQTVFKLPEKSRSQVEEQLAGGLYYAERAITLIGSYAEAHNLKSLLHGEYLFFSDEKKLAEHRRLALASLRRTYELMKEKDPQKWAADFGTPTMLVGEFAPTDADAKNVAEPSSKLIAGGEVVKREAAIFPAIRSAKTADPSDPSGKGVTKEGGAYSLGSGRGALTAAYTPGKVKVEVLISASGEVVFAHVVQGRSDLNGAALVAARKWKFSPAKFEGKPVQVSGVITFDMKPWR